jgi:hypothetical protein
MAEEPVQMIGDFVARWQRAVSNQGSIAVGRLREVEWWTGARARTTKSWLTFPCQVLQT